MATISEGMAKQLASNEGYYADDPQVYSVFRYWNPHFNKECFAIAYDEDDDNRYAHFQREFLWQRPRSS